MQPLASKISQLSGWRRVGAAFMAGALSVLAMAPFHLWLVLFATFPVLVWLLDGCFAYPGNKEADRAAYVSAALVGWAFGFGYFLAGLYWIGFAFLVEAEIFLWLLPFAVTLMPAGLALFYAAAAAACGLLWRPGPARLVGLALCFLAAEWLRGHILTGFPWNALGYALTGTTAMMQWASLFGIYGLCFLAPLIFSAPAAIWSPERVAVTGWPKRFVYPGAMLAILAASVVLGHWRLGAVHTSFVPGVSLRLVQPNIPQADKWKPEYRAAIFQRYLQVSRKGGSEARIVGVTHLIWPESALPFLLLETPEALDAISQMMPDGSVFMTGAARAERGSDKERETGQLEIYNSLLVLDRRATLLSKYDKLHLVPFGEYLPFQRTLESIGLEQLTRIRGGFEPGQGSRQMKAPGVPPFVALICYEIIFSGEIRETGSKIGWMLNLTNDAWFGNSTGPYQHFHQARVRAVEESLPLVRVANNGITAVTDPYGRIVSRLPRNKAMALDSGLPQAGPVTVFSSVGNLTLVLLILAGGIGWYLLQRGK